MIFLLIYLFFVSLIVTFINTTYAKMISPTTIDLIKMSLYLLPLQYLIGLSYAFYYSKGINYLSYATLTVAAYPITISLGIVAGHFLFKSQTITNYEILGIIFTGIGLFFFSINKFQGAS